jgi:hypothetical protein
VTAPGSTAGLYWSCETFGVLDYGMRLCQAVDLTELLLWCYLHRWVSVLSKFRCDRRVVSI